MCWYVSGGWVGVLDGCVGVWVEVCMCGWMCR